jgi:hypothetical protein
MTGGEMQNFSIKGTEAYLQFLVENDLGLEEIPVTHIEPVTRGEKPVFKLILQRRVFDPDSVFIKLTPPNRNFGSNDFAVVEYDADAKVLIVEIRNGELDLGHRPATHIVVVSDLRFLVKNVKSWFERNGGQLSLPEQAPPNRVTSTAAERVEKGLPLETCQGDAIQKSLTTPLTYVWGPPGTGKTKHVLAGAVIQLLLSGKKVGVYAPTNNALEQAMAAVLRIAAGFGIIRDKFLRVGYPSAKFANEFPEVCEIQGLGGRIKELNRQIANYTAVLHCRRGPTPQPSNP